MNVKPPPSRLRRGKTVGEPLFPDTLAERRTVEGGTGFRGRVHLLSVGDYRAEARDPFPRGREAGTVLGRAE